MPTPLSPAIASSTASLFDSVGAGRVAVFRPLQIGDMLCAVPALRALRRSMPAARITLVGLPWARQFAERYSAYVDDFMAFPGHPELPEQAAPASQAIVDAFYDSMRARRFALAIQLHGSGAVSNRIVARFGARARAGFLALDEVSEAVAGDPLHGMAYPARGHESLRLLRLVKHLGADTADCRMHFPLNDADWDELRRSDVTAHLRAGRYICIHPGARFRDKCWPPGRFAQVADQLAAEFDLSVVLTGSAGEAGLADKVAGLMKAPACNSAAAALSIGAMAALMSKARLLICNDTGVSHIAAGLGLKSVVIFSKADMRRWAPLNHRLHRSLRDPQGERAATVLAHASSLLATV